MSGERRRSPTEGQERLEAFSDAVIAVIITILALGLRPPIDPGAHALRDAIPGLLIYVLAFVFLAIYWNNHHHLLRATRYISGEVMWANMLLLFWLSLVPVSIEWIRDTFKWGWLDQHLPVAAFGVVAIGAALAYAWLVRAIIRANGRDSEVALAIERDFKGNVSLAIERDFKGNVSLAIYAVGVAAAFISVPVAYACYVAVAVMWLIPDRRFTHPHEDAGADPGTGPAPD